MPIDERSTCRFCEKLVGREVETCPHCGGPRPCPEPFLQDLAWRLRPFTYPLRGWLRSWRTAELIIGGGVIFITAGLIGTCLWSGALTSMVSRSSTTPPASSMALNVGDVGRFTATTLLATDRDSHDRLGELSRAGDQEGIALMMLAGEVVEVKRYTKCRVITNRSSFLEDLLEVRILEGDHYARSVIAPRSLIDGES